MKNEVAFVIGNGTSRKKIDLNLLVGEGKIFGCNALYRDFDFWDYLVAIDDGMITELLQKEFKQNQKVLIPHVIERFEAAEYNPTHRRRSNAGMNAMIEAIRLDHKILYCLGFDFILEGEVSVDNVYKNTQNYGPETHANIEDNYHRIKYLEWFINRNPEVTFVFVVPDDVPTKKVDSENVRGMTVSTFLKKLKGGNNC